MTTVNRHILESLRTKVAEFGEDHVPTKVMCDRVCLQLATVCMWGRGVGESGVKEGGS